jgi:hypothetical protein
MQCGYTHVNWRALSCNCTCSLVTQTCLEVHYGAAAHAVQIVCSRHLRAAWRAKGGGRFVSVEGFRAIAS